jgi:hypothetical protein
LAEIAHENYISADAATRQEQFGVVRRPVEVEDQAGSEFGQLIRFSPSQRLFPNVRCPGTSQKVL